MKEKVSGKLNLTRDAAPETESAGCVKAAEVRSRVKS
jgi:hypothetical protein